MNTQYEESAPAHPDGHTIYFNRNFNARNPALPGKTDEDLYVTRRTRGGGWSEPAALDRLSTPTFNERNAAFSRDSRLIFFSSDRTGGSGGLDLGKGRTSSGPESLIRPVCAATPTAMAGSIPACSPPHSQ